MILNEEIIIQLFGIIFFALFLFFGLVQVFKSMIKQEKELKEWKQNVLSKLDDIKKKVDNDE